MNSEETDSTVDEEVDESVEMAALFPPPRAVTELVVIDTAPHRAHAFWNILPGEFEAARAQSGSEHPALVIRLHDVTGVPVFDGRNPHDTFDTVVSGSSGRTDIAVWKGSRSYLAELGFRRPDGHLVLFAQSDRFDMPVAPASADRKAPPPEEPEQIVLSTQEADALMPPPLQAGPWPDENELLSWTRTAANVRPVAPARTAEAGRTGEPPAVVLSVSGLPLFETPHIDAEHAKMAVETCRIPPPRDHERLAYGRPVVETEGDDVPAPQPPVPLEGLFRRSSDSPGSSAIAAECTAELVLRGRIPAGRAATLFGRPVAVDADGTFAVRLRIDHPAAVLDQAGPHALI